MVVAEEFALLTVTCRDVSGETPAFVTWARAVYVLEPAQVLCALVSSHFISHREKRLWLLPCTHRRAGWSLAAVALRLDR